MKRVFISLFAALMLSMGLGFAQTTQYAGIGLGYPISFFYGLEDALGEGTDVRIRLSSFFYNIDIGADALFDITEIQDLPITVYGGGGPNVAISFAGGFGLGLSGVVGGEYRIDENFGVFADLGVGYTLYFGGFVAPLGGFTPRGAVGVNYHF